MARSPTSAPQRPIRDRESPKAAAEKTGHAANDKRRAKAPDKERARARLLISHPSKDPASITEALGLLPTRVWKFGDSRTTPDGKPLPGTYSETKWSLSFPNLEGEPIGLLLESAINRLPLECPLWSELRHDGGSAQLILAVVGTKYQGDTMSPTLIAKLAAMGIGLGLEIYAVSQN
ncbi:MAG: DUF4279 domain-containing protein [Hyphomicrobiaceae bacterium]